MESGTKPRAAAAASSFSELKESRRRHVRPELEPKYVLAKPLTTSMETGWAPRDTLPPQTTTGRVKCPETKYAEELLKAGVFY